MENQQIIDQLREAIATGEEDDAAQFAKEAIDAGIAPTTIVNDAINAPMDQVGKDFQSGEIFLPELIMVGDAARAATDVIMPYISAADKAAASKGTVVLGTIQGDMHDIGKNIVAGYMGASGFKIVDLGVDVSPKGFIEAAEKEKANIIAISSLLTTSHGFYVDTMEQLNARGLREKYFVICGGGPITPDWVKEIGADGYGRDARDCVELCTQLAEGDYTAPLADPVVIGALR